MALPIYLSRISNLASIGANVGTGIANAVRTIASTPVSQLSPFQQQQIFNTMRATFGMVNNLVGRNSVQNAHIAAGVSAALNLFDTVKRGIINISNAQIFSNPTTVLTLGGADPTLFNSALLDTSNIYSYLGVQEDIFGDDDDDDDEDFNFVGGNSEGRGGHEMKFKSQAAALAQTALIPKQKFLFVMDIVFNPGFQFVNAGIPSLSTHLTFLTKTWNRPTMEIIYDEVNMYNFRTSVPKRVRYEPTTISFIDDDANIAMSTLMLVMRSISPIFNKSAEEKEIEDTGMDFDNLARDGKGIPNNVYGSSLGPLQNQKIWKNVNADTQGISQDVTTPIKQIKMYHVYNAGRSVNVYTFNNPRVLTFQMNPLSMLESGDGCEITMQFTYDWMFIEDGAPAEDYKEEIETNINGAGLTVNPYTNSFEESSFGNEVNDEDTLFDSTGPNANNGDVIDLPDLPLSNFKNVVPPIPASNADQLGPGNPDDEEERVDRFNDPPLYA